MPPIDEVKSRSQFTQTASAPTKRRAMVSAILMILGVLSSCADAQDLPIANKRLGVDVVRLKGGEQIHGIVTSSPAADPVVMLVERTWLADHHPQRMQEFLASLKQQARGADELRLKRLATWIADTDASTTLGKFLAAEQTRLSAIKGVAKQPNLLFVELTFPAKEVARLFRQPAEQRKIAGLAWSNGLPDVSSTSAQKLRRQLQELPIDIEQATFDLSGEVVRLDAESDREWAVREALVEFYLDHWLEFQGTKDFLVRADQAKPADLLAAMGGGLLGKGMLGGGLAERMAEVQRMGRELGLPEFTQPGFDQPAVPKSDWWKVATDAAEKEGFKGVLIKRVEQAVDQEVVTVTLDFFAKVPQPTKANRQGDQRAGGQPAWESVLRFSSSVGLNDIKPAEIERLKNDPQIANVLAAVRGLGIASVGENRIELAMRHGAATEQALEDTFNRFQVYLSDVNRGLDSPLKLTAPARQQP